MDNNDSFNILHGDDNTSYSYPNSKTMDAENSDNITNNNNKCCNIYDDCCRSDGKRCPPCMCCVGISFGCGILMAIIFPCALACDE